MTISHYTSLWNTITLNVFLTFYIYVFHFSPFFLKKARYWPKKVKQGSHGTPGNFYRCHTERQLPLAVEDFPFIFIKGKIQQNIMAQTLTALPIKMEAASKLPRMMAWSGPSPADHQNSARNAQRFRGLDVYHVNMLVYKSLRKASQGPLHLAFSPVFSAH